MQLREYQTTALEQIRSSLEKGYKAPLLVLPTGAGKTVIFSELAKDFVCQDKNVLILVHRRELVKQACEKLDLIDVDYGVIASGFDSNEDSSLQVASVYTLWRRITANKDSFVPDVIIFDEAHHVSAGTWTTIIDKYKTALRVGVTATPIRLDNRPLGKFFDRLINGVQVNHLVSKGYLCDHKVFAGAELPDLSKLKERRGDYQAKDLKEIMDKPVIIGDAVHQYKKHLLNKPAIAFCVDIAHATKVLEQFVKEGVKAELLTGSMKLDERDNVLNRLRSHKTHVVVSVDVISEGTDLPCVSGAILLRPTKSQALYMQQVGRILRPEKDKTAIVLDHVGNTYRHDFIDIERNWKLEFDYEETKKLPKPVFITCKNCGFVYKPQKSCPSCGLEVSKKELLAIEGELKELKRQEEKQPITIKEQYAFCHYAKRRFHGKNKSFFRELNKKSKIVFENDNQLLIGDNITFYNDLNQKKYGVVIAFVDLGYKDRIEHYKVVPKIPEQLVRAGFNYQCPEIVKEGVELSELEVHGLVNKGKRSQLFVYLETKLKSVGIQRLYLETKSRNLGKHHAGHNLLLLTEEGLILHETEHRKINYKQMDHQNGSTQYRSINFKHGSKVREKIRKLPFFGYKIDGFIEIARQADFKVGYNSDWVYRNFYGRKLIKELKKYHKQFKKQ
jgi:superfamily II DNA or RNA helicase